MTHPLLAGPYDLRGPKLKRPAMPSAPDIDAATTVQICTLIIANAELAQPVDGLTWWQTCSEHRHWPWLEADAAFRLVAAANPKLLRIDDRQHKETPALYLLRMPDCVTVATLYYTKATP